MRPLSVVDQEEIAVAELLRDRAEQRIEPRVDVRVPPAAGRAVQAVTRSFGIGIVHDEVGLEDERSVVRRQVLSAPFRSELAFVPLHAGQEI